MRTLTSESYTIAWFKIADFVARGEKERALTVHRLLMHSVSEPALSYQLEGDILLSFDDVSAIDRYHIAANLYKKAGKIQQAISIYEHVSAFKEDETIYEALFDSYLLIQQISSMLDTFSQLAMICLRNNKKDFLVQLVHKNMIFVNDVTQALLYARFVRALLLYDEHDFDITMYVRQTLDLFLDSLKTENFHVTDMQKFLSDLKSLNDQEFYKAELYLKQIK